MPIASVFAYVASIRLPPHVAVHISFAPAPYFGGTCMCVLVTVLVADPCHDSVEGANSHILESTCHFCLAALIFATYGNAHCKQTFQFFPPSS